jgi:hypothetical protein
MDAADIWIRSCRAYDARRLEEGRRERLAWHEGQVRRLKVTLEHFIKYHEAEAEKYRDGASARMHENVCMPRAATRKGKLAMSGNERE